MATEHQTPLPLPPPTAWHPPQQGEMDALADALAVRMNNGAEEPPKRFLGLELGGWVKFAVMAGAAFLAWYVTVNREIERRPTVQIMSEEIAEALVRHSATPHPPTEDRLKSLESDTRRIRESQIRQEEIDRQQTDALNDIRDDLRLLRRGGKR